MDTIDNIFSKYTVYLQLYNLKKKCFRESEFENEQALFGVAICKRIKMASSL